MGECPPNETCATIPTSVEGVGGSSICVPGLADPLSGTSWQSTTIATMATTAGVTASTYAITFASGSIASDGSGATGAFTATFTQTYGPTAAKYAGCMEMTSFAGGTWSDSTSMTPFVVKVTDAVGTTNRMGCSNTDDNTTNVLDMYDGVDNNDGTVFVVSGNTLTLASSEAVTPYDGDTWTFTRM
jgi:hypothetical protein